MVLRRAPAVATSTSIGVPAAGARCESVAGSRLSHPGKVGDQGLWSRESSLRMLERRR